jgi:long-chain fatty acid transport protein
MRQPRRTPLLNALIVLFSLATVLAPRQLAADDFAFHEASARAASLGGAFTARSDDTAALFYNPAGLAFLGGIRIKTNITLGRRTLSATWPEGGPSFRSRPYEILGGFAASWQPIRRLTVAAGLSSPFDFNSVWPSTTWSGRTASFLARFRTYSYRLALAVEVVKDFAVSAGLDVISSTLAWNHQIPFNLKTFPLPQDVPVDSRYALKGHSTGFFAGALWKVVPAVQIGASFREAVVLDLAGPNLFFFPDDYGSVPDPYGGTAFVYELLERLYKAQAVTCRLTLPREISCGLALTPLKKLSLYADVQWTRWSEFGQWSFRSVKEDNELSSEWTTDYQEFYGITPNYGTQGVAFALEDTKRLKAGIEFRPVEHFALRVGYARHESSVVAADRTPVYPDLDRNVYSFGLGYEGPVFSIWRSTERIADLSFDVFARYAAATPGESTYPGFEMTYESKRFVWGVGVGFSY